MSTPEQRRPHSEDARGDRRALLEPHALLGRIEHLAAWWGLHRLWIAISNETRAYARLVGIDPQPTSHGPRLYRLRKALAFAPGIDCVRRDRHDRMTGLDPYVDSVTLTSQCFSDTIPTTGCWTVNATTKLTGSRAPHSASQLKRSAKRYRPLIPREAEHHGVRSRCRSCSDPALHECVSAAAVEPDQ